jgi:hypothetical protein
VLSTLDAAVSKAPEMAEKRCQLIKGQKLHPHAWKAICSRDGVYTGKNQNPHNWQEDFANIILLPFTDSWDDNMNKKMPKVLEKHQVKVLKEFSTFAGDVE